MSLDKCIIGRWVCGYFEARYGIANQLEILEQNRLISRQNSRSAEVDVWRQTEILKTEYSG